MNVVRHRQNGAVSLFVVIFSALLIITIATAFIRIMVQDQMQASSTDLSKSALDSAHVGVEDAKRAIIEYYKSGCQDATTGTSTRCDELSTALVGSISADNDGWTAGCQATVVDGIASLENGEVPVKTSDADKELDQAYTCVKVQMNPIDVIGSLTPGTSRLYQLKPFNNEPITQIKVQWYTQEGRTLELPDPVPYVLPDALPDDKPMPPVMRTQLLQYKGTFQASVFDSDPKHNSTLFLLPANAGGSVTRPLSFISDSPRQDKNSGAPQPVECYETPVDGKRYACEVVINLPCAGDPCTGPTANDRTAYLRIGQIYSADNTDFRITMLNASGVEVRFTGVQSAVDSTGRASDIFRRIRSRIDFGSSGIPLPEAAVDLTKSLCKEFMVTNTDVYAPSNNACARPPGS